MKPTTCPNEHHGQGSGSIRIVKDAVPDGSQDFRVTCSLGALLLDDDLSQMLSNSGVFSGVVPGAYVVVEDAVVTWVLVSVTVTGDLDGGSSVNLANRAVTLDLDPGENISVVFVNERQIHPGDYDVDGDVDSADLTVWRDKFGTVAGGETIAGDGDGDQDADGADFLIWQRNLGFGAATAATAASSLPTSSEPDSAAEAAIAGSMTTMTAATPTGFSVPSALSAAALGEDAHFDCDGRAGLVFMSLTTDRFVDVRRWAAWVNDPRDSTASRLTTLR
jgi:hypothetical protein